MFELKNKFYLGNVPKVNLIAIDLGEQVRLFGNCTLVKQTDENMTKKFYNCDHANVLDITQVKNTDQAREEFEIMLTGQRPFGYEMRPSGFVSYNVLGRNYGRDDVDFDQQPHGLITAAPLPFAIENQLVAVPPTPEGLGRLKKELKVNFFKHSQACRDQNLQQEAWRNGYKAAEATQIDPKKFAKLAERLEECEKRKR